MTGDFDENLVTKRTFEDCLRSQQRLRKKITELRDENRPLTEAERDDFFSELARSTYGLGVTKPFNVYLPEEVTLGNVESGARFLACQKTNMVRIPREGKEDSNPVEIGVLWEKLLYLIFSVFAIGLDRSSAMSKEHDSITRGDGYTFNPDE